MQQYICINMYMYIYQIVIMQINKWFINIIIVCKRNNMYVHVEVPHSTDKNWIHILQKWEIILLEFLLQ